MNKSLLRIAFAAVCGLASVTTARAAEDDSWGAAFYEVKITNLTRGQQFTPILATSHKVTVSLFKLGQPASAELVILAEEGNAAPLAAVLDANPGVGGIVRGNGLTNPGATTTLTLQGRGGFTRLSVAAMLIPTNDAFFAVNGIALPRGYETVTVTVPAYDAGSERNDELCASIPGPLFVECGGSGGGAKAGGGEGYVHIHAGIHGIGNFTAADRDWRNPVALITVRRLP